MGNAVRFPYSKVFALLAYLLLEPGKQRRELLTDLLWPQPDEDTARANLRNAVHALKRLLGPERIESDREHICFKRLASDNIDTDILKLVVSGKTHLDTAETVFGLLVGYEGELMPGFCLPDAPAYMEWLDIRRLACHRQLLALSEDFFQYFAENGNRTRQVALAQTQTLIDPWNESFHLRLIQLLAEDGRTATALAHYDYMRGIFRKELDIAPGHEVRKLISDLKASSSLDALKAEPDAALGRLTISTTSTRPVALLYVEIRCLAPSDEDKFLFLQQARQRVADEVKRQGAHACITPDGSILAYFGYPDGLPNASQRALRTACNIRQRGDFADILLRFSLHYGPMLLCMELTCPDALGMMSDIVMKLAAGGRPGDILATAAFVNRISVLDLAPLERPPAFYLHEGMAAYRIVNVPGSPATREPPLIGREQERLALQKHWAVARRGGFSALVVCGPPGCGKSRLARWMIGTMADPGQVIFLQCQQTASEVPFSAIAEAVRVKCGIHPGDDPQIRLLKLERLVNRRYPGLSLEYREMLGWLAGLPLKDEEITPSARRKRLHDTLLCMLAHLSGNGPVLIVVEDLHWADPSTLQFIEELLAGSSPYPCLLLVTARPPKGDIWQPSLPRITPAPFTPEQSRNLVQSLLDTATDAPWIADIVASAQGNPLFIESLTYAHATAKHPAMHIPSLEESILAPIAHDGLLRSVALGAAALGEIFRIEMLRALFPEESNDRFYAALRALRQHGLFEEALGGEGRFHHALIRDTLYECATPNERRQMHRRIQTTTIALEPGLAERQPHWLAHHASQAGDLPTAVELFEQAACLDLTLAAHAEAVGHFQAARLHLERLPASRESDRRILRLLLGEGNAIVALRGYGAFETRAVFSQVLERGNPQEEPEEVFLALYGLWLGGSSHGGYRQALRYADKLQRMAEMTCSPLQRLQTAYAFGNTYLWLGELASSRQYLEEAIALYEACRPTNLFENFHEDTGVISLALLAWVAWLEGDTQAAEKAGSASLALARRLAHPYSLSFALACAARLAVIQGDIEVVAEHTSELLALADRHAFALWQGVGSVTQGWVQCARGQIEGLACMDQGLAFISQALPALEATFLSMYADALFRLDRVTECADLVGYTMERCTFWQDHYMEAELLRLRSVCADLAGEVAAAPAFKETARVLASRQGAHAFLKRIEVA